MLYVTTNLIRSYVICYDTTNTFWTELISFGLLLNPFWKWSMFFGGLAGSQVNIVSTLNQTKFNRPKSLINTVSFFSFKHENKRNLRRILNCVNFFQNLFVGFHFTTENTHFFASENICKISSFSTLQFCLEA